VKLALGPLQYYWPRDTIIDFYDSIAAAAVDIVYLGETVCSRRHELRLADWMAIGEKLEAAGKEVVLSSQVLTIFSLATFFMPPPSAAAMARVRIFVESVSGSYSAKSKERPPQGPTPR